MSSARYKAAFKMCCQDLQSHEMLAGERFFGREFGATYVLLLELHFGLQQVKGSEKSCSKETNPAFTQAAFCFS